MFRLVSVVELALRCFLLQVLQVYWNVGGVNARCAHLGAGQRAEINWSNFLYCRVVGLHVWSRSGSHVIPVWLTACLCVDTKKGVIPVRLAVQSCDSREVGR